MTTTRRPSGRSDRATGAGETLDGPEAGTGEDAIPRFSPVCTFCYWWKPSDGRTCAAYKPPARVPLRIWSSTTAGNAQNGYNHLLPVAGDHGIVFELAHGAKPPHWLAQAEDKANVTAKRH